MDDPPKVLPNIASVKFPPPSIDPYWHYDHVDESLYNIEPLRLFEVKQKGVLVSALGSNNEIILELSKKASLVLRIVGPTYIPVMTSDCMQRRCEDVIYEFNGSDVLSDNERFDSSKWHNLLTSTTLIEAVDGYKTYAINLSALNPGTYYITVKYPAHYGTADIIQSLEISRAPIYRYAAKMYGTASMGGQPGAHRTAKLRTEPTRMSRWPDLGKALDKWMWEKLIPTLTRSTILAAAGLSGKAVSISAGLGQDFVIQEIKYRAQQRIKQYEEKYILASSLAAAEKDIRSDLEYRSSDSSIDKWPELSKLRKLWDDTEKRRVIVHVWQMAVHEFDSDSSSYMMRDESLGFMAATFGSIDENGAFRPTVTRWQVKSNDLVRRLYDSINTKTEDTEHIVNLSLGAAFPGFGITTAYEDDFEQWLAPYVYELVPDSRRMLNKYMRFPDDIPDGGTGLRFPVLEGLPTQPNRLGLHVVPVDVRAELVGEGRIFQARASLRRVLLRRGFTLSADEDAKIEFCSDLGTLERWLDQSVLAQSPVDALR